MFWILNDGGPYLVSALALFGVSIHLSTRAASPAGLPPDTVWQAAPGMVVGTLAGID